MEFNSDLAPCDFWAFPTMKRELWGKKFQCSMVCSTFSRSGWSTVRRALLVKEGTLRKRLSMHLHKVLTQSNRLSPWTLKMALITNI
jgi:hypothetical protein